ADRTGNFTHPRTGSVEEHPGPRRARGDDRNHPEIRCRLLQFETRRAQIAKQLKIGCDASTDRNVSVQIAYARIAARDRSQLWRQASFDRDPLDSESRGLAQARYGFQQPHQQLPRGVSLAKTAFPQSKLTVAEEKMWVRTGHLEVWKTRLLKHLFSTG